MISATRLNTDLFGSWYIDVMLKNASILMIVLCFLLTRNPSWFERIGTDAHQEFLFMSLAALISLSNQSWHPFILKERERQFLRCIWAHICKTWLALSLNAIDTVVIIVRTEINVGHFKT